jgi:hypothetical protein
VAIHISKNEDTDRTSKTLDNDSVRGEPGRLLVYKLIASGVTVVDRRLVKCDSRPIREIIRVTESRDNETEYKMTI